jgi:predicted CoA-substrate-specific enzyme activase
MQQNVENKGSSKESLPGSTTSLGICLGATTVSMVEVQKDDKQNVKIGNVFVKEHDGDPRGLLDQYLNASELQGKYMAVTGRKFRQLINVPSITEPEAAEIAYKYVNRDRESQYDAIVSAGGETFMVYEMDKKGKISRVSSGNKCASGTGEFFLQQIRRMNVDIDEAINLSKTSTNPHHLSGRCSVFCKSDCTHALNKGVSIADVAAGLARMIAGKIEELLVRIGSKKIMVVGGTAQNDVVIDFVKEKMDEVSVPEEAPYFEALGAALWALNAKQDTIPGQNEFYRERESSFDFLKPLSNFVDMVDFKEMAVAEAKTDDVCIIGLDVGSTTTKAVLLRSSDDKVLAQIYLRTNGNPVQASRECYKALAKQVGNTKIKVVGVGVTGSGRYISGLHAQTDGVINEIIAHARAAAHFDPDVDTIFEIGGQDAKYTFLTNSVASDYAMNEACSAGTGSFLEESAYESLGIKMEDIGDIALKANKPPNFSDQCSAFISSDINTALQEGIGKDDIIAGLVYSICINYVNRVKGSRQVGGKLFMQGGVCYNKAVPVAMAALTGKEIIVPPQPGLMGAYGVALEIKNMLGVGLLEEKEFTLKELGERTVEYGKSFICQGKAENCDRKCEVAMIHVADKKIPFGGACNKYYNMQHNLKFDIDKLNHIADRRDMLFNRYVEVKESVPATAPVIGINKSFQIHTLYPMFASFFNELGCKVVMSDKVDHEAVDRGMTSFCLSAQTALGLFSDLLDKKPDYIFMPQIMEMNVSEQDEYRKEYQTVCMFVQGEPFYQKATFMRDRTDLPEMITPALNFMEGFHAEEATFIDIAKQLGFSAADGKRAHDVAVQKQNAFFSGMKEEGRRILKRLEEDPSKIAIVLFGHSYNSTAIETNKGVPFKFASRGIEIIPYDFLPYEMQENYKDTYWEMGQRVIKAARIVKDHPQLFGCYLTNFLCAIDSMMVPHFRDLMQTKPSLTIEVDEHTADAGVNTRIEAFMDVVKNYIKIRDNISDPVSDFQMARSEVDQTGKAFYVDSDGNRTPFTDPSVKVVIPSMGDLFAQGSAVALRHQKWNAEALPVCDREALDLGRSVCTGKECLPIINIIGEVMKYLKYQKNKDEKLAVFCVAAGGCCRVGQYEILLKTTIEKYKLKNVAVITLENDSGYAGLGIQFRLDAAKIVYAGDIMEDIRATIKAMAVDKEEGMRIFNEEWKKIIDTIDRTNKHSFYKQLKLTAKRFREEIKLDRPIEEARYIGIVGEIFVRRDHHSLLGIPEKLAEHGFVMLDAHVSEWVRYVDFLRKIKMFETQTNFIGKVEGIASDMIQDHHEKKMKKIFATSGLYEYEMINIPEYMEHSTHFFPLTLTGEPGLSSGSALHHLVDKYCGVINIGPFGCMNSRMTEAVTTAEMTVEGKERAAKNAGHEIDLSDVKRDIDVLPFLSIESDGNPFSQIMEARFETFLLQAERLHDVMMERKKKGKK